MLNLESRSLHADGPATIPFELSPEQCMSTIVPRGPFVGMTIEGMLGRLAAMAENGQGAQAFHYALALYDSCKELGADASAFAAAWIETYENFLDPNGDVR